MAGVGSQGEAEMSLALDAEYFNWFLDGLDEQRAAKLGKMLPAPIVFLITTVLKALPPPSSPRLGLGG